LPLDKARIVNADRPRVLITGQVQILFDRQGGGTAQSALIDKLQAGARPYLSTSASEYDRQELTHQRQKDPVHTPDHMFLLVGRE